MSKQRTRGLEECRHSFDYVTVATQYTSEHSLPLSDLFEILKTKMRGQAQRGPLAACLQNKNIEVYNLYSDEPLCKIPYKVNRGVLAFRNVSQLFALHDSALEIYDINSQTRTEIIQLNEAEFYIGMMPVGEYMVFHSSATLSVYDPTTGKIGYKKIGIRGALDIAALGDRTVVTCSESRNLQLWDISNGITHIRDIPISPSYGLFSIDSIDENTLIYATSGFITSVNVHTGVETHIITDGNIKRGVYIEIVDRTKLAVLENQNRTYVCRLYDLKTKQNQVICSPASTTYRPFASHGSILVYYDKVGLNFHDVRTDTVVKYIIGEFGYTAADVAVI